MTKPYRPNPLQWPLSPDGLVGLNDTIEDIYNELMRLRAASYLTDADESSVFSAARRLLAGSNITFDDTVAGQRTIASSGGGGGGGLVLIEQHTASGSGSLDFTTTISATYDLYVVELVNIIPANDNVDFMFRVSTDGGSSYDSGANYARAMRFDNNAFNTVLGADSGLTSVVLAANVDATETQASLNGTMKLFNPGSASLYKPLTFHGFVRNNDTHYYSVVGQGVYRSTTAVNAFQFLFSAGNIASGTIRSYGVAKS